MSAGYKYAICDQVKINSLDDSDITSIQDTFSYDVIVEPTLMPDGNYIVVYCGNKPYALYGTTVLTASQVNARRADPDDPWYVDPDVI
jgi:hypothetical protein